MRVERELGGGGMSRVFVATDLSLDRQVVKVFAPELSAGVSVERLRREIQVVAKLQHPHIVPILSAGDAEGALFYVMPFLRGDSLRARIARDGRLPVRDTMQILREVLDALSTAYEFGVVHRDIKPENILSGAGHAVVADFGVFKAAQDSGSKTTASIATGTPAYMAPEQIAALRLHLDTRVWRRRSHDTCQVARTFVWATSRRDRVLLERQRVWPAKRGWHQSRYDRARIFDFARIGAVNTAMK